MKESKKSIKNFLNVMAVIVITLTFIMPGTTILAYKNPLTDTIISVDPATQMVDQDETFTVS